MQMFSLSLFICFSNKNNQALEKVKKPVVSKVMWGGE
nr:MAG TPA: hypothetical protein [Caudoviricetes sp.]